MPTDHHRHTGEPYPGTHSSSMEEQFHGGLKSKNLWCCSQLRQSILQPRMPQKRAFGSASSSASYSTSSMNQPPCIATIRWPSCLPQTTISIHTPSISTFNTISSKKQ